MRTPDKIHISKFDIANAWNTTVVGIALTTPHPQTNESNYVSFVRKDALLEWAKNLKDRWCEPPESKHSPGCVYMLEQVIDKLNSL